MSKPSKFKKGDSELYSIVSKMLVPEFILNDFSISDVYEHKDYWQIELREKTDRIPVALASSQNVISDGYCNPLTVLSHSFSLKPVYLKIYRRRWKISGSKEHHSNQYDFTIKGIKIVPELGIFLNEEDRRLSR